MLRRTYKNLLLVLFICAHAFATPHYPKAVEKVLEESGKNRVELEKVLNHYQTDSLKYKASCFLIENMDIHYSQTYYWADSLNHRVSFNEFGYPDFKTSTSSFNALSSHKKWHPVVQRRNDLDTISSTYLIRNIDDAFELKSRKWAVNLTDDQFYNYLLSYRIMNEQFDDWREKFRATFASYTHPLANERTRKVCTVLSDSLRKYFFNTFNLKIQNKEPAYLSPKQLLFRRQGACEDIADWGVYILRSLGIASTVDFTPAWATSTGSHYWNVAFNEDGEEIPFFMGDDNPNEFRMLREPSKVFRIAYGLQPENIANQLPIKEIPEGVLRNKNQVDVTDQYWKTTNLKFTLPDTIKQKTAFIAVFNGLAWKPIWWSSILHGNANFSKTTCGVVYLPMYYIHGKLTVATDPCILRTDNSVQFLKPDVLNRKTITLEEEKNYLKYRPGKKYTLLYWDKQWKKLEQQTIANEDKLIFNNVPTNALMVLIPEYSEGKERPFTLDEKGKREWW